MKRELLGSSSPGAASVMYARLPRGWNEDTGRAICPACRVAKDINLECVTRDCPTYGQ